MAACPSPEQLALFLAEQTGDGLRESLEAHVETCAACQRSMEHLVGPNPIPCPPTGPVTCDEPRADTAFLQQLQELPLPPRVPERPAEVSPPAPADPASRRRSSPAEPMPGTVGPYEVLTELGRGGMGVVYMARLRKQQRFVALKMIHNRKDRGGDPVGRFRREAEAVARLQHPNVAQIFEIGEHAAQPFLALEYVGGGSLAQFLGRQPQDPAAAARFLAKVARAVQHAHEHGIVHRALKPANILLARNSKSGIRPLRPVTGPNAQAAPPAPSAACSDPAVGAHPGLGLADLVPKITDFGLAQAADAEAGLTTPGVLLGTPTYLAPEQLDGRRTPPGPACDVYALGVILYEMLTGRPPFLAPTIAQTCRHVLSAEPVSPRALQPDLSRDLETICLKCLHKKPAGRYASACELADDLEHFLDGRPILARPTEALPRDPGRRRRKALAVALAAGLVGTLLLGAGAAVLLAVQAPSP